MNADTNSSVTVTGDVKAGEGSATAVSAVNSSSVTVGGNVTGGSISVQAENKSSVDIKENVAADNGIGVVAKDDSTVNVGGTVSAGFGGVDASDAVVTVEKDVTVTSYGAGVEAADSAEVHVKGSVNIAGGVGVYSYDKSTVTVEGDINITGANEESIGVRTEQCDVTVKGDINGGDFGIAAYGSLDREEQDVENDIFDSNVTVKGNVTSENGIHAYASEVTVEGDVTAVGEGIYADSSKVTIGGDVTAAEEGIYAYLSEATVGGNLTVDGDGIYANSSKVTIGGDLTAVGEGVDAHFSEVTIGGDLTVNTAEDEEGYAEGHGIVAHLAKVTVDGDLIVSGDGYREGIVAAGSTVEIHGDVSTKYGDDYGTAIDLYAFYPAEMSVMETVTDEYQASVTVKGNVSGDVMTDNVSNMIIEGNVDAENSITVYMDYDQNAGTLAILGTVGVEEGAAFEIDYVDGHGEVESAVLPTIIVGEITDKENLVSVLEDINGVPTENKELAEMVAEQILYYIDVQESQNGDIAVSGTRTVEGYMVANENDTLTVTVSPDEGYEIESVSGGKASAVRNGDGTWSISVPRGGGISISAVIQAIAIVTPPAEEPTPEEPEPENPDSDGSKPSSPSSNGSDDEGGNEKPEENTYNRVQVVLMNKIPVHISSCTIDQDGLTAGIVTTDTVSAVPNSSKMLSLPAEVAAAFRKADGGDLSQIGVDTTGMTAIGNSVTLNVVGTDQPAAFYFSDIDEFDKIYVLFYDIVTGQWKKLEAVYDAATGLVNFVAPGNGTAIAVIQ